MARVNIEDKLFTDSRWMKLLLKTGNEYTALGIVTAAWILAQKNWVQHKMIPEKAWPKDFEILIDVELASRRADGNVYIKGSKRAFSWLEQRVEAGRLGGSAHRKVEKSQATAKRPLTPAKQNEANASKTKPLTLTPSLPLVPTLSLSQDQTPLKTNTSDEAKNLNREIWDAYRQSYESRYRVEPVRNASVNAKISQLAKRLGPDSIEVVKYFLKHNEGFYVKKLHDIGLCLSDCESLRTQWKTNTQVTSTKVKSFEKVVSQIDLANEMKKGGF